MTTSYCIKKVDKNSDLAKKLLDFIKNFSWVEVKQHVFNMVQSWDFEDWEAPFVAMVNEQIVGMATIRKTDYYPLPEIYPWISCIFVTEKFRGHRISELLINAANIYAKEKGFAKTYIPTEFVGFV